MSTGANRFERSFLCTQRKLTSDTLTMLQRVSEALMKWTTTHFFRIRNVIGTALINATSFLLDATLTPTFHSGNQPGGCNAQRKNSAE
jgi:hypothetical protein